LCKLLWLNPLNAWPKSKSFKVKVILRLTVSQSVCLGVEPNLALWMPISYTLPVSRMRPNGDWWRYAPRLLARRQVTWRLPLGVKLLCGRFPQLNGLKQCYAWIFL
jgi:hypothetical protein